MPFENPESVFENQLKEIFSPKARAENDPLLRVLSLILHHNAATSDLNDVYRLLGLENFVRLIHLMDGRTVRFPTSNEMKEALVLAICYYYREIENLDWPEIKNKIPWEFHSISVSRKINSLNSAFRSELLKIFANEVSKK